MLTDPIFLQFQEKFPGARPYVEARPEDILRDYTLHPAEMGFGVFGPKCHALGWPVIPQSRTGSRLGAPIAGRALEWKPFQTKAPTTADVKGWSQIASSANTALVLGENGGARVRVIDIDVDDEFWSAQIVALADQHLGRSNFRRQGRAPRWMLFYREADDAPLEKAIRTKSMRFEERGEDGKLTGSKDGLEILGAGRLVTIYGRHHSTGGAFLWPIVEGAFHEPTTHGPEALPIIDAEKVQAFLKAVHELRPILNFARSTVSSFESEEVEYDPDLKIVTPPHRARRGSWSTQDGKATIVDGRKDWLLDRTLSWILHNASHVRAGGTGLGVVREKAITEALRFIERSGDWTMESQITRTVVELFDRTARRFCEGEFRERTIHVGADGKAYAKPEGILALENVVDKDLGYIKPAKARRRSPTNVLSVTPANSAMAANRALLDTTSREALGADIANRIASTIRGFLTKLWDARDALEADPAHQAKLRKAAAEVEDEAGKEEARVTVRRTALRARAMETLTDIGLLKTPTGSGKTTATVRIIRELVQVRGPLGVAIGFMLPSHANIAEVQGVAMETATPEEIEAIWDEALKAAAGLKTMAWKGKVLAGCYQSEQMKALYSAGISASGMCRQRVRGADGEWEESVCKFWSICGAIKQLELAAHADIIFMPHAYITVPLPKQLKEAIGALFIDESYWHHIAQCAFLPIDVLSMPRRAPRLTVEEKKVGLTELDLLRDRDEACEIATRALIGRRCAAQTLYEYTNKGGNGVVYRGKALAEAAYDVCNRADTAGLDVKPDISMAQVEAITANPRGKDLWLEKRFWSVVLERIHLLELDAASRKAAEISGTAFDEVNRAAKHDVEFALQYRPQHDMPGGKQDVVRISWLKKLNFSNVPLFLLDASANVDMLKMLYPEREFDITVVDEPLHLRIVMIPETGSDQSMLPNARHRDMESRVRAAERQSKIKALIGRVAIMNGHTRVLVASTKAVRTDVTRAWNGPTNIDFAHYGAMAGLDFAKRHGAIVCVGRMSSPVAVIDGYAAAFARHCPVPELPYDEEGTGYVDGKELTAYQGERKVTLRNGGDMVVRCAGYPEHMLWHNRINAQFREEQLRQAIGRLRPVHRKDATPPVAFMLSTCLPEGLIVDDVVNLDDVVGNDPLGVNLAEIISRNSGVLDHVSGGIVAPDVGTAYGIERAIDAMNLREQQCFTTARIWENGSQEPREVRLAPWISEIEEALLQSAHTAGRTLNRFEVTDLKTVDTTCAVKQADKLDRLLSLLPNADTATIEELRAERAARAVVMVDHGMQRFGFGAIPFSKAKDNRALMSLDVALIMDRHGFLPAEDEPIPKPEDAPLAA